MSLTLVSLLQTLTALIPSSVKSSVTPRRSALLQKGSSLSEATVNPSRLATAFKVHSVLSARPPSSTILGNHRSNWQPEPEPREGPFGTVLLFG